MLLYSVDFKVYGTIKLRWVYVNSWVWQPWISICVRSNLTLTKLTCKWGLSTSYKSMFRSYHIQSNLGLFNIPSHAQDQTSCVSNDPISGGPINLDSKWYQLINWVMGTKNTLMLHIQIQIGLDAIVIDIPLLITMSLPEEILFLEKARSKVLLLDFV